MYGQTYLLSVESWLAAPVFLVAGSSVLTLRLPMLAMNVGITLLLLRQLERPVSENLDEVWSPSGRSALLRLV